jgi:hypothetical protein
MVTIAALLVRHGDGAYGEQGVDTSTHKVGFAKRQLSRAPAAQYSLVIGHIFFPFVLSCGGS